MLLTKNRMVLDDYGFSILMLLFKIPEGQYRLVKCLYEEICVLKVPIWTKGL